jgi:HK97 family phage major capsid protein
MPYKILTRQRDGETVHCLFKMDGEGESASPVGDPLGCHPTPEAAERQRRALYANEASAGKALWITVDDMLAACPSCGEYWQQRGWEIVNVKALSAGSLAAFCSRAGSDPGFWTKCAGLSWGPISEPAAFCAWLHHECLGRWPAEKALGGADHMSRVEAVENAWHEFWRAANTNMPIADGEYNGVGAFSDIHAVELDEKYIICAVGDKLYKVAYTEPDGSIVFDAPDKWTEMQAGYTPAPSAPAETDTPGDDYGVMAGGAVKALISEDGTRATLRGPAIVFSDKDHTDQSAMRDFFTAETEFGKALDAVTTFYDHGRNRHLKATPLGRAQLTKTSAGIFFQEEMEISDAYRKHLVDLALAGRLGTSTASPPWLIERVKQANGAHWIKTWIPAELSYTTCPAEVQTNAGMVVSLKSLPLSDDLVEPEAQPEAGEPPAADAAIQDGSEADTTGAAKAVQPNQKTTEVLKMEITEQELQSRIDTAIKAAMLAAPAQPLAHGAGTVTGQQPDADNALKAFGGMLRKPQWRTPAEQDAMKAETVYMQADRLTGGGYMLAPIQVINDMIKSADDAIYVRQAARRFQLAAGAPAAAIPVLTNRFNDSDWTPEVPTGISADELKFGARILTAHPLRKRVLISEILIQSTPNVVGLVQSELDYVNQRTMEKAYMAGSGTGQPLGIFTPSADGISTARDIPTADADLDNLSYDDFLGPNGMFAQLKPSYWQDASLTFIMSKEVALRLRTIQDGMSRYIYDDNVRDSGPDLPRLLGKPVFISEYAPIPAAGGDYICALGALRFYGVLDVMEMQIKTLQELYAEQGLIGYISLIRSGGIPLLEEAFVRLTLKK